MHCIMNYSPNRSLIAVAESFTPSVELFVTPIHRKSTRMKTKCNYSINFLRMKNWKHEEYTTHHCWYHYDRAGNNKNFSTSWTGLSSHFTDHFFPLLQQGTSTNQQTANGRLSLGCCSAFGIRTALAGALTR